MKCLDMSVQRMMPMIIRRICRVLVRACACVHACFCTVLVRACACVHVCFCTYICICASINTRHIDTPTETRISWTNYQQYTSPGLVDDDIVEGLNNLLMTQYGACINQCHTFPCLACVLLENSRPHSQEFFPSSKKRSQSAHELAAKLLKRGRQPTSMYCFTSNPESMLISGCSCIITNNIMA
jgi:hypothetical protein